MDFKKAQDTLFEGMSGMVYLMVVMIFAWSLGTLCDTDAYCNSYVRQYGSTFICYCRFCYKRRFGDHCSPLSDTTILASMGAASDHIDHFRTQFPYAVTVACVSAVLFAVAGFIENSVVVIPGIIALAVGIYLLHKLSIKKYDEEVFNSLWQ
ncbi:MAG: Na+/H+ antiporter NhaC family protein [Bacillota bacterium]|nr:Na+/H+ antiporter NhaC family protein [Bacillota bacterium]